MKNRMTVFGSKGYLCLCAIALAVVGGLAFVGCDANGDDDSGGVSVPAQYRGLYQGKGSKSEWKLEVKEKTLEVKKGAAGQVKTIQVTSALQKSGYFSIGVPSLGEGMSGGSLRFMDDGSIETNEEGKLQYYPGDTSGEEIPDMWEKVTP